MHFLYSIDVSKKTNKQKTKMVKLKCPKCVEDYVKSYFGMIKIAEFVSQNDLLLYSVDFILRSPSASVLIFYDSSFSFLTENIGKHSQWFLIK